MSELDDQADHFTEALEKLVENTPEAAVAKLIVIVLGLVLGSPLALVVEPLLRRALERLGNKAGKEAVAAIAKEVEAEEGYRRVAAEVRERVEPALRALFEQVSLSGREVHATGDDVVTRVALLLHRMEQRLSRAGDEIPSRMSQDAAEIMAALADELLKQQHWRACNIRRPLGDPAANDLKARGLLEYMGQDVNCNLWKLTDSGRRYIQREILPRRGS